ncbi:hypothetical protein TIFTF001_001165 [Ficus carica]|uniref:Uncharacterized protein n=1 Tax=Ficus carica TaxID=3494 RepID=A0AA88CQZ2_FICCA|nr:hypothetical protein TIFTF001_001165 [Ficus carica]
MAVAENGGVVIAYCTDTACGAEDSEGSTTNITLP